MLTFSLLQASLLFGETPVEPRFNVKDFGAKADGVTDDSAAFSDAIKTAIRSDKKAVVFVPAGRYSLKTPMDNQGMLSITGATNLTLEGEKGTMLIAADPDKHIIFIKNSSNVTVRRLELDRNPLVFTQGRITSMDIEAKTVEVSIDSGYDEPDAKFLAPLKKFLVFTTPEADRYDRNTPGVPGIVARKRIGPMKWQFTLDMAPAPNYANRRWLLWNNVYKSWGVMMIKSQDCLAEDIQYYGGGANGGIGARMCSGTLTFRRFNVGVPPGSDRLIAAAGGGQQAMNRGTMIMDSCDISRVDDDACSMGSAFEKILRQVDPHTIVVEDTRGVPFQAGDAVTLWDWLLKKQRSEAKIVQCKPEGKGAVRLTLDASIQVLHPVGGPGLPLKSAWNGRGRFEEFDGVDRVADVQTAGKMIIRNCRFQVMRARCILVKGDDSLIENNTFYNTHMTAILAGPEFYWGEGPAVRNLTIRNNRFINIDGSSINLGCHQSDHSYDNMNIVIEGNTFENYGAKGGSGISGRQGTAVLVRNADGVTIRNNTFATPSVTAPANSKPLLIEASRNFLVKDNKGIPVDPINQ